ncbi:hypothetical protein [Janthinobacterium sp. PC23-8]|uniref:hypothetical protein n=1 Tax=Janthinobacterium sp. PC23-8 TaxID=2012679 RepID=UPI001595A625|nr:hypothetical protein [Janthinobacterium sp. PC23-8]
MPRTRSDSGLRDQWQTPPFMFACHAATQPPLKELRSSRIEIDIDIDIVMLTGA